MAERGTNNEERGSADRGPSNIDITKPYVGLYTDSSPSDQPTGTYRFALNTVNKNHDGNIKKRLTENSNEISAYLTKGYKYLSSVYMGKERFCIFSVNPVTKDSEIGIFYTSGKYTPHVNDSNNTDKLGFSIEHQIDAIYRLRRGCDDTVYFVDQYNNNRYYNFSKPHLFQTDGKWDTKKFDLQKRINTIPSIDIIEVLENSGELKPGSYGVYFQYVDEDLNGTSFIPIKENINIYHDKLTQNYDTIQGSVDLEGELFSYGKTNKAISVTLNNIDREFIYYRLAFLEYTNNSQFPESVKYTDVISTSTENYIYTGSNIHTVGTVEELVLSLDTQYVGKAKNIVQDENKLLLSNLKGEDIKYCILQSYASKINADCYVKDTIITNIEDYHNPKNPLFSTDKQGHMPGEVYSYGIVYVFEDATESPEFHIPGKSSKIENTTIFSPGAGVHPMSNVNNTSLSEEYLDNNSNCSENDYWGLDSLGDTLLNEKVRHHRFPTRDEIGVGFVREEEGGNSSEVIKRISVSISGEYSSGDFEQEDIEPFTLKLKYVLDGIQKEVERDFYPIEGEPIRPNYFRSPFFPATSNVENVQLTIKYQSSETETPILFDQEMNTGLEFSYTISTSTNNNTNQKTVKVPILGLKLSNIEIPSEEVLGKKIIGYRIVRQERTKKDKTVLDTGVILPMIRGDKYVSTSLLSPDFDDCEIPDYTDIKSFCNRTSENTITLLTPRHKFIDESFDDFTEIVQVGNYTIDEVSVTGFSVQDAVEGTSATGDENKKTDDDDDMTLRHSIKSVSVKYSNVRNGKVITNDNTTLHNLNALSSSTQNFDQETIYNLSNDNKHLILSKDDGEKMVDKFKNSYPYVIIRKNIRTFYQNFRGATYYDYNNKVFATNQSEVVVFGGDVTVAPLRYSNHLYLNAIAGVRQKRLSLIALIGGIVATALGAIFAIITGGSSLVPTIYMWAGILGAAGGLALASSAVVEMVAFKRAYEDLWEKGLKNTVWDKFIYYIFISKFGDTFTQIPFADDTVRWHGDIISDLWFETDINIALRVPEKTDVNTYLQPLTPYMDDNSSNIDLFETTERRGGKAVFHDRSVEPESLEENFFYNKLFTPDPDNVGKGKYNGISLPVLYFLNEDHNIKTRAKKYFNLPLEYDCCSDCVESFPHRWVWSEQSFQEELTDNYRTFLLNNYKDISGETGEITDMFILNNHLFFHTEESLYNQPKSYQERVTGDIVTFIGTGSYGELPERRIVDDRSGNSAGTKHKFARLQVPTGIYFPCEKEGALYHFNGQQLSPITRVGMERWFKKNIELVRNKEHKRLKGEEYPFLDNTSNRYGIGYALGFDPDLDRILFTKKDFSFTNPLLNSHTTQTFLCRDNLVAFPNFDDIISNKESEGWNYLGFEDCKLKFSKKVIKEREEQVTVVTTIPNDASIVIVQDTSGSFDATAMGQIRDTIEAWYNSFSAQNSDWNGDLSFVNVANEQVWNILDALEILPRYDLDNNEIQTPLSDNIIVVNFTNEAESVYHSQFPSESPIIKSGYTTHYNNFINKYNELIDRGGSFSGLIYPISFLSGRWREYTAAFVQHVLFAMKGGAYAPSEIPTIPNYPGTNFKAVIEASLREISPYPEGMENYGWKAVFHNTWDPSAGNQIILPEQFQSDMENFLEGNSSSALETIQVNYEETIYEYVEGTIVDTEIIDRSWTLSYSLEDTSWTSFHSYMPIKYLHTSNDMFSIPSSAGIWKHGRKGHHRTFYGIEYKQILEYVIAGNPFMNKIFENLTFHISPEVYDENSEYPVLKRDRIFSKLIAYNDRQCTGELDIKIKDEYEDDYLEFQIKETDHTLIDINEGVWSLNDLRDIRVDYNAPMWKASVKDLQDEYYIDKILNEESLDKNKNWYESELLRGKFLIIRIVFDKFVNTNYISDFFLGRNTNSNR